MISTSKTPLVPPAFPSSRAQSRYWMPANPILEAFEKTDATAVLIQCKESAWYAATRSELESIFAAITPDQDTKQTLEASLGPDRTPTMFPDQPLASALPYFRRWPLLARFQSRHARGPRRRPLPGRRAPPLPGQLDQAVKNLV